MNDQATINRIHKWAEKNYQKYFDDYQNGASTRTLRTAERYDDIRDICILASKGRSEEDETRKHIHRNQEAVLKQFRDAYATSPDMRFTVEEVEQWLRKMMI